MAASSVAIQGLDQAKRLLALLPDRIQKKVTRDAMRKACRPGLAAAKAEARKHGGGGDTVTLPNGKTIKIHKSLRSLRMFERVKSSVRSRKNQVTGSVGELGGGPGFLVEHGHRLVVGGTVKDAKTASRPGRLRKAADPKRTGQGRVVGRVRAYPWIKPAFDQSRGAMTDAFFQAHVDRVAAEAEKLGREVGAL